MHLLDGATGSMLRRAGVPAGVCSETWILDHPQTLIALQRAYLAAGSEIIYAPTFGANRVLLGHYSSAFTMDVYADTSRTMQRDTQNRMEEVFKAASNA